MTEFFQFCDAICESNIAFVIVFFGTWLISGLLIFKVWNEYPPDPAAGEIAFVGGFFCAMLFPFFWVVFLLGTAIFLLTHIWTYVRLKTMKGTL